MSNRTIIDIHAIQAVPPNCVNRDDTGAPKSCIYGGVPRARVSSQCWKRAVREAFPDEYRGVRTLKVPAMVRDEILSLDPSKSNDEALSLAASVLGAIGVKLKKKDAESVDAAMFLSNAQVRSLAAQALADPGDKAAVRQAMLASPTADIAMFGRMVAADPSLNIDACVQVAHAISTHAVHTEYDYFTAVDEMNRSDESGAGHVNTAEFNSAVLYRYACVDVSGLLGVIGDEAVPAAVTFTRSFLTSMPAGKSNSFANFTLPGYVRICVRDSAPISFAGAFENPVKNSGSGYFDGSVAAFKAYEADIEGKYGMAPVLALDFDDGSLDVILEKLSSYFVPAPAAAEGGAV